MSTKILLLKSMFLLSKITVLKKIKMQLSYSLPAILSYIVLSKYL